MEIINKLFYSEERKLIDKELLRIINDIPSTGLRDNILYHLKINNSYQPNIEHSKRLRSFLCLLMAKENGYENNQVLQLAITIELIHNSTLIIDDIQDNDEIRCGEPALWKKVGLPEAINAAFYLSNLGQSYFHQSLKVLQFNDYTQLMNSCLRHLFKGQQSDIEKLRDGNLESYFEIANGKTGSLLLLSLCFGSMPFHFNEAKFSILVEFCKNFSCFYQIRDDFQDILNNKSTYDSGHIINFINDIKENKQYYIQQLLFEYENKSKQSIEKMKAIGLLKSDNLSHVINAFKIRISNEY